MMRTHRFTTLGVLVLTAICLSMPATAQVGMFDMAADWTLTAEGNVKAAGTASVDGDDYTLEGNGNDIWGSADEGYFIYTEKSGSNSLQALLYWDDPGTNDWSKMIVMIREKGDLPGSIHLGTQLRGLDFGDRAHITMRQVEDGGSNSTQFYEDPGTNDLPVISMAEGLWVRTTRVAEVNMLYSEWSYDGVEWILGGSQKIEMADSVAYGLALTNHVDDESVAVATFKNVEFVAIPTFPVTASRSFSVGGFQAEDAIVVTVEVTNPNAAVTTVNLTDTVPEGWAVSDVSDGGTVSGSDVSWSLSAEQGNIQVSYTATASAAPGPDNNWAGTAGSAAIGGTAAIALEQGMLEGDLVFNNHADVFPNLDDLGGVDLLGTASYDAEADIYTLSSSGNDIWNNADEFHYLYTQLSGDFTLTGTVELDETERSTSTDGWIKGMLMARQNLSAGSSNFGTRMRRDGQFSWQMRANQDGSSSSDGDGRITFSAEGYDSTEYPAVKLERRGDEFSIFYMDEFGTGDWVQVQTTQTLVLQDPILVGLAATAHQRGSIQYVLFKDIELDYNEPVSVGNWSLF